MNMRVGVILSLKLCGHRVKQFEQLRTDQPKNQKNPGQAQNFSGMEVVLADGSVVRTSTGGVENAKTWQCYRWGYGPWVDGLFLQTNLGIVTKLGLWLMKKPEARTTWIAGFDSLEAAAKTIEVMRNVLDEFGAAQRARNSKLKNALDPNHILAPGKSGIL